MLLDGVDVGDLGNQFDFGPLSTTAIESAEVYRGPDSNLYGAGADIQRRQPHHSSRHHQLPFPALPGRCRKSHSPRASNLKLLARTRSSITSAPSVGCKPPTICPTTSSTWPRAQPILAGLSTAPRRLRGTAHYGVSATGVPNAWDFYHVADDATAKRSGHLPQRLHRQPDHGEPAQQRSLRPHAQARAGCRSGPLRSNPLAYSNYCFGPGTLGNIVTITGANGYSATGQAVLDCSTFKSQLRLQPRSARSTAATSPSLRIWSVSIGFQYEDERGAEPGSTFYPPVERTNYDYLAARSRRLQESLFLHARWQPRALLALRRPDRAARRGLLLCASPAQRCLQRHAASVQLRRV